MRRKLIAGLLTALSVTMVCPSAYASTEHYTDSSVVGTDSGCDEEISNVEQSIFKAGAMSKMLDSNLSLKEIAQKIRSRHARSSDAVCLLCREAPCLSLYTALEVRRTF